MGWVVTPLRSVTFLDDQTTSKSMQEKLHDGQCHKTKTWNKIWNTIHTTLCSRVWPECNKGWKKMFLWMGGCKSLLTKHGQLVQIRLDSFQCYSINKSSPLRRLMPIEILATRPPLRRSCTSKSSSSSKDLFLSKICQSKMCHLLKLVLYQTALRSAAWMHIHLCHGADAMALATLSSIQVFWASVMPCMGASGPIHCPALFLAWMA